MKPDAPASRGAERVIAHLNEDHADALLDMARAIGGCPETSAARCVDADREGLDLIAETPAGETPVRVPYDREISSPANCSALASEARRRRRHSDRPPRGAAASMGTMAAGACQRPLGDCSRPPGCWARAP